ncbi:MAG TPA: SufE family protein [Fimbriimonadaceae bacterium]|jgi:cysteine desulfuration protein SufE
MAVPEKLQEILDTLELVPDRSDRIQFLISLAEQFKPVSSEIAAKPYPEQSRVPGCESEAFVFATASNEGTLDYHFAVENPQGVSAMALAAILQQGLSGAPLAQIQQVPDELVYSVFGRELSMGKSMGLIHMVQMVKALAQSHSNKETMTS